MPGVVANPTKPGAKRAPRVTLLLNERAGVLSVDRSLAGTGFANLSALPELSLHDQLHTVCSGQCEFAETWRAAWSTLKFRDSVEWEIDDKQLGRLLRFHLSRPLAPNSIDFDRRRTQFLLAITDITTHRREYEKLVESQQELIRLVAEQEARANDDRAEADDGLSDSGIRFIAGLARQHRITGRQLILAQEDERKRIAAELHDGIAQTIGVIKFKLEACMAHMGRTQPGLDLSYLESSVVELKSLVDEIRRISSNLAPSMLENFGLHVAVDWLCEEFESHHPDVGMTCDIRIDETELPDILKIAIYRVVQEALSNVGKYGAAENVAVSLESNGFGVRLIVRDDGAGFDPQGGHKDPTGYSGLGLQSMRERVEATGGRFELVTARGEGVSIEAEWPVSEIELIRS